MRVVEVAIAVSVAFPGRVVNTVIVNCALAPFVSAAAVHVAFPLPWNFGSIHVHPDGAVKDTKCIVAGTASVKVKCAASFGPLFATVAANDTDCPLTTVPGLAATVVTKFAPGNANGFTMPVYAYLC